MRRVSCSSDSKYQVSKRSPKRRQVWRCQVRIFIRAYLEKRATESTSGSSIQSSARPSGAVTRWKLSSLKTLAASRMAAPSRLSSSSAIIVM